MKKLLSFYIIGCMMLLSCVDDNYDLSDIDTMVEVNIADLILPIKIDEVTLDAILDLDEDSKVKKVNGEYAILEDGTFKSDAIKIPTFSAAAPRIEPISETLTIKNFTIPGVATTPTRAASDILFSYDLSNNETEIAVNAENVDEAIISVERITVKDGTNLSLNLTFDKESKLVGYVTELEIRDLVLVVIKGLEATVSVNGEQVNAYDPETGKISLPIATTKNHQLNLTLHITGFTDKAGFVLENQTFKFEQQCKVESGVIYAGLGNLDPSLFENGSVIVAKLMQLKEVASEIQFVCTPKMSDINAETFSGKVKYTIDGIDVDPVNIDDLPDFLSQDGTDIKLGNPQIYLEINNPLAGEYGLKAEAGLTLTSYIDNTENKVCGLSGNLVFDSPVNQYCLSPKEVSNMYKDENSDFSNAKWKDYSSLSGLLSGKKLPQRINIGIENPGIPEQSVEGFRLGEDIDKVVGKYLFYAPLELAAGSKIT